MTSTIFNYSTIYDLIHCQCEPSLCSSHCYLISEPIETIHSMWPHYGALFRGHLNFSTVSLLSQTTFRYSMSNKSPEQLSPLFVQELTNVTRAFYISPGSAELANSLCLCIISHSLSPHNQILFYAFICSFHCCRAVDLWGIRWTSMTCLDRCSIYFTIFLIKPDLQRHFLLSIRNESIRLHCFLHCSVAACSIKHTLTVQNLIVHFNPPLLKWLWRTGGARVIISYLGT